MKPPNKVDWCSLKESLLCFIIYLFIFFLPWFTLREICFPGWGKGKGLTMYFFTLIVKSVRIPSDRVTWGLLARKVQAICRPFLKGPWFWLIAKTVFRTTTVYRECALLLCGLARIFIIYIEGRKTGSVQYRMGSAENRYRRVVRLQ
jgi:hypothetical protein